MENNIKIIETTRDAWQGIKEWIPTKKKAEYINNMLDVGFDTIETGSFVSPRILPQMKDSGKVLKMLNGSGSKTRIMVLVPNVKGFKYALKHDNVDDILYPFSISETFLIRNINTCFDQVLDTMEDLQLLCLNHNKRLVVYFSMGFGNPYGDPWDPEIVLQWAIRLRLIKIRNIHIADTLGHSTPKLIEEVFSLLIPTLTSVEFGLHMHTRPDEAYDKIDAAYKAGVRRFDSVCGSLGGCPLTGKELVSNLSTHDLIDYCERNGIEHGLDVGKLSLG